MTVTTNRHNYKRVLTIITAILNLWFGYSNLVCAESDYSTSKLNRDMNAIMNSLPKNKEQPYVPYGQGNMNEIQRRFNEAKKSGEQTENLKVECASGNDNACIAAGIDIEDPCRSYIADYQARDYCRLQQCIAGNQDECNKSKAQSERVNRASQAEIDKINNKERWRSKSKESYDKSNLDAGAKYCSEIWDYNKHICATADTLKRMDGN
ncbi:MAG: hypothetical protein K9L25_05555 [Methylovulum sp.]|nr:hypothetical protein [Methylovulum sp.]